MATDQFITRVPVLLYHGVDETRAASATWRERKYWVSPGQLTDQLELVAGNIYRSIRVRDIRTERMLENDGRQHVVLTIDDGHASDFTVFFPKLVEGGSTAEFFVNTATIGEPGYLGWDQIREMSRSGMGFQSHATNHIYLTKVPTARLREELVSSKRQIEDRLGRAVEFLAPPYGDWDDRVLQVALEIGYLAICTGRSRPARCGSTVIDRAVVYRRTSTREFRSLLAGNRATYRVRAVRLRLLQVPKWIILHGRWALQR